MADQVIPATEKSPDEIEREMLQTRESLTEKVAALENQVVGTAQTITETVSGTVEAVKSFVSTAPETVSETVKQAAEVVKERVMETFDISGQVRSHPWAAVGASAAVGALVGYFVFGRGTSSVARRMSEAPAEPPPAPAYAAATPATPRQPGVFDEVMGMLGNKAKELARTALESASAAVKESIQTQVPRLVGDASERLVDKAAGCPTGTAFSAGFDARRGM